MRTILAAAATALLVAGAPAAAATYKIDLFVGTPDDPYGDGVADWFGTFAAAASPGPLFPLQSAAITVAGVAYDGLFTFGPYLQFKGVPPVATLDGLIWSAPIPNAPATVATLGFSPISDAVTPQFWYLTACGFNGIEVVCNEVPPSAGGQSGGFTVSEVAPIPLPAAGALLPLGLGALAAMSRRRRI